MLPTDDKYHTETIFLDMSYAIPGRRVARVLCPINVAVDPDYAPEVKA